MTKPEQKTLALKVCQAIEAQAFKEYRAIEARAWKEYESKCKKINEQCDVIKIIDGKEYRLVD